MDAAFQLSDPDRAQFFRSLMQTIGCTYICLWSYVPHPSNCLICLDGYYIDGVDQPSTSSGASTVPRVFDDYRRLIIDFKNERIPGLAFRTSSPYLELKGSEIQNFAFNGIQSRLYREARIQTAIFMGCKSGEIELGISNIKQINMERLMKEYFPEDFAQKTPELLEGIFSPADQSGPFSSSSSSLKSFDSALSNYTNPIQSSEHTNFGVIPIQLPLVPNPRHQESPNQALSQIRSLRIPTREMEDEAIMRAMVAVLSSSSSTTSSSSCRVSTKPTNSAFKRYRRQDFRALSLRKQSMIRRAISYYHTLNIARRERLMVLNRPSGTQVHHMISERKRREKLNESFLALRSLLPPGTKKDKATVLSTAREYLTSLTAEIDELWRKNKKLEEQLVSHDDFEEQMVSSLNERVTIRITNTIESTFQKRSVDLGVIVKGECDTKDLLIRLLEFLKQVSNVTLVSMEARTHVVDATSLVYVNLRLNVEGDWDEATFQEAVRRVVADLGQ